jgi:hypothetical protein
MADRGRKFEDFDAVQQAAKKPKGLLIGLTGPQFSGKSYSAGELATGIQRVVGGRIYWVDTENDRALELVPYFKDSEGRSFRHVPFPQPESPKQYEDVVRYCLSKPDCGVIILDQCTHEHLALLDMRDAYLDRKAGDNWDARQKYNAAALVLPKAQRKRFEELVAYGAMRADGTKVPMILLYRATDKSVPGKGKSEGGDGNWVHKGWQAETTSTLPYYMTARFLLPPGSDGKPNLKPDTEWEKLAIRNPQQFRDWFQEGFQLNREIGERLARWAMGEAPAAAERPASGSPAQTAGKLDEIVALLRDHFGDDQKAKAEALLHSFGTSRWKGGIAAMDDPALLKGLAALKMNLDPAAHMVEREPGFDPGTEPEPGEEAAWEG